MARLCRVAAVAAICATAADLQVLDEDLRCGPRSPCVLRVRAQGGHLQRVHAKAADASQAGTFESNSVFAPADAVAAITLKLNEGAAVNGASIPIDIHFTSDGKAGSAKKARLTVEAAASELVVFDSKPVYILAKRNPLGAASGVAGQLTVRSPAPLTRCPEAAGADVYRTSGDERYALEDGSITAGVTGTASSCRLSIAVSLPPGNYTSAGGAAYLRAGSGKDIAVPILIRIKDNWGWPLTVLILGHAVMWSVRLWMGQIRPRRLNQSALLRLSEELRLFEARVGDPAPESRETIRGIKVKLAGARRLNEDGDAAAAARTVAEARSMLDGLSGAPVRMSAVAVEAADAPAPGFMGRVRSAGDLIAAWDLPVELVAMAISILIGSGLFANATQFGTYEDYLKVFLFGFGISTSTQGFLAVLGQIRPAVAVE